MCCRVHRSIPRVKLDSDFSQGIMLSRVKLGKDLFHGHMEETAIRLNPTLDQSLVLLSCCNSLNAGEVDENNLS